MAAAGEEGCYTRHTRLLQNGIQSVRVVQCTRLARGGYAATRVTNLQSHYYNLRAPESPISLRYSMSSSSPRDFIGLTAIHLRDPLDLLRDSHFWARVKSRFFEASILFSDIRGASPIVVRRIILRLHAGSRPGSLFRRFWNLRAGAKSTSSDTAWGVRRSPPT